MTKRSAQPHWGLIRHYWIMAKLGLTTIATIVLLLKTQLIGYMAHAAASTTLVGGDLGRPRSELVLHAGGGLVVLLVIATLSVYKPWGRTRYGRQKLLGQNGRDTPAEMPISASMSTPLRLPDANNNANNDANKNGSTGRVRSVPLKFLLVVLGQTATGFVMLHLASGGFAGHRR